MLSGPRVCAARISTRASRSIAIGALVAALACMASSDARPQSYTAHHSVGAPPALGRGQVLVPKRVRLIIGFVQTVLA